MATWRGKDFGQQIPPSEAQDLSPPKKKIRYQSPDVVIVSVGSGDARQEFEHNGQCLATASPDYLDVMLSSGMKEGLTRRIEFPDKDPEEWKLVSQFISPDNLGEPKPIIQIDHDNVLVVLPWFHQFMMTSYVNECDRYLARNYIPFNMNVGVAQISGMWKKQKSSKESDAVYESRLDMRRNIFDDILRVMQVAEKYGLGLAKESMERKVAQLMNWLIHTDDLLLDVDVIKTLLKSIRPLRLNGDSELLMNGSESLLSRACETILLPHVSRLTQGIIDEEEYFPHLFYSFMQIKLEKEKYQAETTIRQNIHNSANKILNTMINRVPGEMSAAASKSYKRIVSDLYTKTHKSSFKKLGVSLPADYSQETRTRPVVRAVARGGAGGGAAVAAAGGGAAGGGEGGPN